MIRKDLTIRYACGSYWIISTDVHLYADASYHAPVMTNETGYHIWICLKKHFSYRRNSRNNFRTVSYFI